MDRCCVRVASPCWRCRWPLLLAGVRPVACGNLSARATDEWTHTYPLTARRRSPRSSTANGRIEVEGVDGSTVEVRAERIAKGVDRGGRARAPAADRHQARTSRPTRSSVETERIERHHDRRRLRSALPRRDAPKSALRSNATNGNGW